MALVELCRGPKPVKCKPALTGSQEPVFSDEELGTLLLDAQPKPLDELDSLFAQQGAIPETLQGVPEPSGSSEPTDEEQESFDWTVATEPLEAIVLREAKDGKKPVKLTYQLLVRQIKLNWPAQFRQRSQEAWYLVVRRWCKRVGLSLRKTNRLTPPKPKVTIYVHKIHHH